MDPYVRNIKIELVRHNKTIKELAKSIGLSVVAMSNKINGKTPFTLREAKALVDYFNSLGSNHTIGSLFYPQEAQKAE